MTLKLVNCTTAYLLDVEEVAYETLPQTHRVEVVASMRDKSTRRYIIADDAADGCFAVAYVMNDSGTTVQTIRQTSFGPPTAG